MIADRIVSTVPTRVNVDADLSEASVEDAMELLKKHHDIPILLIVSEGNAFAAGAVCNKYGLQCVVLPKAVVAEDSWALAGRLISVWSPGA